MAGRGLWVAWGVLTVGLTSWLGYTLVSKDADRRLFLPGQTTHAHYQIEMKCDTCHTDKFGTVTTQTCQSCHAAELKVAKDTHPASKFEDPRNAPLLKILNAMDCVTCHREHDPHATSAMAVTLPADYCWQCHKDVGKERPSHKDFAFNGCAASGCHNYHDNRALYEDFLTSHMNEKEIRDGGVIPARNFSAKQKEQLKSKALTAADADGPAKAKNEKALSDWSATAHAQGGVNCAACHGSGEKWKDRVAQDSCKACHATETAGFLGGRHGMRTAAGLPAMKPGEARQPMKAAAAHRELNCASCHTPHRYDTAFAASDACLQCHNDDHSRAYEGSLHAGLWKKEIKGDGARGTGVSCATCHMPRETITDESGETRIGVNHNQNDNLRPNEKMVRSVCIQCHGLGFTLDSLADPELIRRNFTGRPGAHVESIDLAERRFNEKRKPARKEP